MARIAIVQPDHGAHGTLVRMLRRAGHLSVGPVVGFRLPPDVELVVLHWQAVGRPAVRDLRARHRGLPIVVVVERPEDAAAALDAGADDVLCTPLRAAELTARVDRLLPPRPSVMLVAGDLELDLERGVVTVAGRAVVLTGYGPALLGALMLDAGRTLAADRLAAVVAGEHASALVATIAQDVEVLRNEVGGYIEVIPGRGYRLDPDR